MPTYPDILQPGSTPRVQESLQLISLALPGSGNKSFWNTLLSKPEGTIHLAEIKQVNDYLESHPPRRREELHDLMPDEVDAAIAHAAVRTRQALEDAVRKYRCQTASALALDTTWRFFWQIITDDITWLNDDQLKRLLFILDMVPYLDNPPTNGYKSAKIWGYYHPKIAPVEATIQAEKLMKCLYIHETRRVILAQEKQQKAQAEENFEACIKTEISRINAEYNDLPLRREHLKQECARLSDEMESIRLAALSLTDIIAQNNILPQDDLNRALNMLADIELLEMENTMISPPANLESTQAAIAAIDEHVFFMAGAERIPDGLTRALPIVITQQKDQYIVNALKTPKGAKQFSAHRRANQLRMRFRNLGRILKAYELEIEAIDAKLTATPVQLRSPPKYSRDHRKPKK